MDTWSTAPFESLNTEAMQQSVNKYNKVCAQCEKGLPVNTVLPMPNPNPIHIRCPYP